MSGIESGELFAKMRAGALPDCTTMSTPSTSPSSSDDRSERMDDGKDEQSVIGRVNALCLNRLEADSILDIGRIKELGELLESPTPPKADQFVQLFQREPDQVVE